MKKLPIVLIKTELWKGMNHGWGNGYVVIPEGHRYWYIPYEDIDVDVHGGLTFSNAVKNCKDDKFKDFDQEAWVVGFDTGHYRDTQANCPMEWVFKETQRLRDQLMEA